MKFLKANWHWIALGLVGALHLWQLLRVARSVGYFDGVAAMMIEADRERRELQLASLTTVVKHITPAAPAGATQPEPEPNAS